ncbi:hypothetical protein, partial [Emergencia timonensis]|uniref:hypothetical protein n=1 Tax=Emergencia timonensis TaxID=1776384 RepID=UPI00266CAB97
AAVTQERRKCRKTLSRLGRPGLKCVTDLSQGGCGYAGKAKMPENVKQIGADRYQMRNSAVSGRH